MANTVTVNSTLPRPASNVKAFVGTFAAVNQTLPMPAGNAQVLTSSLVAVSSTLTFGSTIVRVGNRLSQSLNSYFPLLNSPFVDPQSGVINPEWHRLLLTLWLRTGGTQGVNSPNT